jgi:type III secretion protein L
MLIWLRTEAARLGAPDGVLRHEDLQELLAAQSLRSRLEQAHADALDGARREAQAQLDAAREQARAIVEEAQAQAERLRREAYEEGMRQAVQDWHERQAAATLDKGKALRDMHARLAEVVTAAVERIVHSEDRAALYQRALRNVQSLTRGATALKLRVGPADYDHAQACIGSIEDLQAAGLQVEVVSDSSLRPGSCVFESDLGVLDASLQTQLDGLRAAMERAVRRAVAAEEEAGGA